MKIEKAAKIMVDERLTIREIAIIFSVSKSTIHYHIHHKLKDVNYELYLQVLDHLNKNKKEGHIRGGDATRKRWKENKN